MYRVLIVEDDPVITEALAAQLKRWGLEARGVQDLAMCCGSLPPTTPSWC